MTRLVERQGVVPSSQLVCVRVPRYLYILCWFDTFAREMPCVAVWGYFYVVLDFICGMLCLVLASAAVGYLFG